MENENDENIGQRRVGVRVRVNLKGQIDERDGKEQEMPDAEFSGKKMGVKVPQKEHALEKHKAGKPYMSSAAKIRGQQAAHKGFHAKQQDSSRKNHSRQHRDGQSATAYAYTFFCFPRTHVFLNSLKFLPPVY
jgi:hypothetical protein